MQINSQVGLTQRMTYMGTAQFTYSLGLYKKTYYAPWGQRFDDRYFVDSDGTEWYMGAWGSSFSNPAGFYGTFSTGGAGFYLSNAGPPGDIWQAGNWKYEMYSSGTLYRIYDPNGNIHELVYDGNNLLSEVKEVSTGRKITFEYDSGSSYINRAVFPGGNTKIHYTYSSGKITSIIIKDSAGTTLESLDITYTSGGLPASITKDGDSNSTITYSYQNIGSG